MRLIALLAAGGALLGLSPCAATATSDTLPPRAPHAPAAAHAADSTPAGPAHGTDWFTGLRHAVHLEGFAAMVGERATAAPGIVELEGVELHLGRELTRSFSAATAIVTTPEGITAPVVMLDLHVGGGLIAPRGRLPVERGFHLIAGRFDLPIGTDWALYAPTDRMTVSAPLVTEQLHDGGLNDWGVQAAVHAPWWRGVLLAARGAEAGWRVGGRAALAPFSNPYTFRRDREADPLEVGISLLRDRSGATDDLRWVVDASSNLGVVRVQGELAWRDAAHDDQWRGWHLTADAPLLSAGPLALRAVGRIEGASHDVLHGTLLEHTVLRRGTLGLRADLAEWVIAKVEWHRLAESAHGHDLRESAALVQCVVVF